MDEIVYPFMSHHQKREDWPGGRTDSAFIFTQDRQESLSHFQLHRDRQSCLTSVKTNCMPPLIVLGLSQQDLVACLEARLDVRPRRTAQSNFNNLLAGILIFLGHVDIPLVRILFVSEDGN